MTQNIEAIFDHGVFRPVGPVVLPEGTRVQLRVEEENGDKASDVKPGDNELPTLLERMKDFVGTVDDLPPDSSVNLDHYLYGTPKRQ
jgi:predicted DNA-binding antitoxin AbrB/MazE fold protein